MLIMTEGIRVRKEGSEIIVEILIGNDWDEIIRTKLRWLEESALAVTHESINPET